MIGRIVAGEELLSQEIHNGNSPRQEGRGMVTSEWLEIKLYHSAVNK